MGSTNAATRGRPLPVPAALLLLWSVACAASAGALVAGCSTDSAGEEATPNPNGALTGAACEVGFDCRSGLCHDGHCAPAEGLDGSATDGVKNGDETDVDCGGSRAPKCGVDKSCAVAGDCVDGVCKAGTCAAASPTDGI